ncbi:hypothetical protein PAXRUDRAFT_834095 [Paxillus rubicundulus Ve08.2h10]|uniref:Uncharacterized protein n=1 Tax=Paxillus rubicundulus Ve08.2h10 TaxID=930991 RepID=A0A0D0CVJ3_9AGAM|nr:hypothetical protein PAXRUDRAFT_834095 [Paxillus rubicundulus Ve08.2h10]
MCHVFSAPIPRGRKAHLFLLGFMNQVQQSIWSSQGWMGGERLNTTSQRALSRQQRILVGLGAC